MQPARGPLDSRSWFLGRRRLLRIGGLGSLGLNLAGLLRAEGVARPGRAAAPVKSCILIFYYGGPSHHDTWDMKPRAPREVRGEFQPIATAVPGLNVSEHLPHCARVTDKLAVVRSLHHPMTNHNAAAFAALCGRMPLKGDLELLANDRNDPPCYGSALSALLPHKPGMPPFVALPHVMHNVVVLPGQVPGFLGSAHSCLQVARDPNAADFHFGELELPGDLSLDRLDHRESLLHAIDGQLRGAEAMAGTGALDAYNERAFQLLRSAPVRRAFDIAREDPRTRDRYGRTKHGQSVLLARRLVEAGVRFVSVYDHDVNGLDNWDTHVNNFGRLKDQLLPPVDRALAALVGDLSARGLLDSTLVIAMGEFGRTPKLNRDGGRDHWPNCYSAVLAGGGVRGGTAYGTSDKLGAYPDADPVTPGDLAATLFWRFGLDPESEIQDLTGRPYRLAEGKPIRALFA
jgi:hypothetical protein